MKLLIVTLTFLSVFASAFASEASQQPIVRGTSFDAMKVSKSHFSHINVNAGSISIDHSNKMVRLNVNGVLKKIPAMCGRPNGPQCQLFGYADVELQMTSDVSTLCSRTYTAERDARPVDGILQKVVVTEFAPARNARCIVRLPTVVTYETKGVNRMTGKAFGAKSTFSGPAMERLMIALPVNGPFIP